MSKNQTTNRIQKLFEPSPSDKALLAVPEFAGGWSWTCNAAGLYQFCGAGVSEHLQIEASRFIGQPISTFQVHPDSVPLLQETFQKGSFPCELDVLLGNHSDQWVPVHMHIFAQAPDEGAAPGWYGFNLLLAPASDSPSPSRSEIERAILLMRQGQPVEARRLLKVTMQGAPEDEKTLLWLASTFEEDARRLDVLEDYLAKYPGSRTVRQVATGLRGRVMQQATEKARLAAVEIMASEADEEGTPAPAPRAETQPASPQPEPAGENQGQYPLLWAMIIIGATILAAVLYVILK